MEKTPVVEELLKTNEEFKKLWEEHEELDKKVEEMSMNKYLTPEEEIELKKLKKLKLLGKEKLVEMIDLYKKSKGEA